MKLRADSTLTQLTDDQRDELYDRLASGLSYRDAAKRAACAPPEGFGLEIHVTTLWRWFPRERARRHLEALAEAKASVVLAADPDELARASKAEFAHALFQLSTSPESLHAFNALSRAFHRLEVAAHHRRVAQLAEQRLALDRERHREQIRQFELDASALAAQHAAKLLAISGDSSLTNVQKGEQARPILFPAAPNAPTPETHSTAP